MYTTSTKVSTENRSRTAMQNRLQQATGGNSQTFEGSKNMILNAHAYNGIESSNNVYNKTNYGS